MSQSARDVALDLENTGSRDSTMEPLKGEWPYQPLGLG